MIVILAVIAALLTLPALVDLIRRPDLRRMGVRNAARRPTETALIIVGSALGTAIICAALLVGDTFDHSIRDIARQELGEIDEIIDLDNPSDLDRAAKIVTSADVAGVDGILPVRSAWVSISSAIGGTARVEPGARISSIDFAIANEFGQEPPSWATPSNEPTGNEIVINDKLAGELNAAVGDTVTVHLVGTELDHTVTQILPTVGIAGSTHGFVASALFDTAAAAGYDANTALLVSNTGGVFDSADNSQAVLDEVLLALSDAEPAIEANGWPEKEELLEDAADEGANLSTTFGVVGGFSVLAGILLLINLFVMLAEERKPTLGVLRAIGWKRSTLRRAFAAEGLLYAAVAAVVGAVLGIGVGWIIIKITQGIITDPEDDFRLVYTVDWQSLLTAGLIGLVIAMASVRFTSWRISRLNIISAIRDLPEPKNRRSDLVQLGAAGLLVAGGGALFALGLSANNPFAAMSGIPLGLVGLAIALRRFLPPMLVAGVAGALVVLWGGLFFPLMPTEMTGDIDIEFFLLFGAIVVGGGVAIATVIGPWFQRLLAIGDRPAVEARVGMAYPIARPLRTASSLAMYSLIIFSLAFMSVMSNGIGNQAGDLAEGSAAGHDILVNANQSNPISTDALAAVDGVGVVNPIVRGWAQWSAEAQPDELEEWGLSGISPTFAEVGSLKLMTRAERFASDAEAFAAVAADPTLVIVPQWFMNVDSDVWSLPVGSQITAEDGPDKPSYEVVGVIEEDWGGAGLVMSVEGAQRAAPHADVRRFYVKAAEGADGRAVAERIETTFITNGAYAETFVDRVNGWIETDLGFFRLLQGYLQLGLVIGIAGLAVTLFRAVRERRRQIGMMRAMGLPAGGIRQWFLTESTFVSLMGIVTGVSLGVLTSWLMIAKSEAFEGGRLPFGIPWVSLVVIIAIPFVASGLASIIPARRAAALLPSEALRLAD